MILDREETLEWAIQTLARYEQILNGHRWQPEGWQDNVLRFWTGEFDDDTVTVEAIRTRKDGSEVSSIMVWRAEPCEVEPEIGEYLEQHRIFSDPNELGELASVPFPVVPTWIFDALSSDMADEALQRFAEAEYIIRSGRQ